MIEVVSGKGTAMFTSFWNDGQEAEAFAAAERRAEEKGATVRVERNGEVLATYRPSWRTPRRWHDDGEWRTLVRQESGAGVRHDY